MWEISNIDQTATFLFSILLGTVFSLLYDILKALRTVLRRKMLAIAFWDALFCLIFAVFTFFLFMLRTKGQLRGFVFLGEFVGFFLWRSIPSRIFLPLMLKLMRAVRRCLLSISCKLSSSFDLLCRKYAEVYKKFKKTFKKVLKRIKQLLYNQHCKNVSE